MKNKISVMMLAILTAFASPVLAVDDAAKTAELLAAKKAELNGHEWEVKLSSAADPKKITGTDILVFKDLKFESKEMVAKGFNITNYTISLQEGGPTVWETMQSDDKGQSIFWRGEWEGESMRGVMSKQSGNGKNEDYYFSSVSSKVIADTPKEEPKAEEAAAPAEEAAVPALADAAAPAAEQAAAVVEEAAPVAEEAAAPAAEVEQPKKKKKGWF